MTEEMVRLQNENKEFSQSAIEGDSNADLATAEVENQEDYQKVINRKHFQYHNERRKREKLEAELAELRKAQEKETAPPNIPDVPDTYDVEYAKKLADRDAAIASRAQWEQQQKEREEFLKKQQETELQKAQEEVNRKAQEFTQKAVKLGITAEETLEQQNTIIPFISHKPDLANFLLAESDGPALVKYLSSNVMELDKIVNMSDLDAAVYLRTNVSPKAAKLVKKAGTSAPDPVEALGSGAGGATQSQSKFLEGVTFE